MSVAAASRSVSASPTYVVRAHSDMAAVDPGEWDALLEPDDFNASHRFVRACQEARVAGAAYRHITVRDGAGLAATASFCRMPVALDTLSTGFSRGVIRRLRRWRPGFLRVDVAFCGLPVSTGQSSLRLRAGSDARTITSLIERELRQWARGSAAAVLCFKEFAPAERTLVEPLTRIGYIRVPSLPSCSLAIEWRSFEEYVGAMRSGYRRQILAGIKARDRAGLTVRRVVDWEPQVASIFPLYEQVMDRAPFRLERLNREFFRQLAVGLADRTSVILVERDGALLAAAVLIQAGDTLTFLFAGIDYRHNSQSGAYLTLVTQVVAEAIHRGARRLELGQTTYDLKQRLGAEPDARWLYIKCPSRAAHLPLRMASGALFPTVSPPPRRVFRQR